jgi:hypothetical protein
VTATWSQSIERADRLRPTGLARPMLHLVALIDPNGIPATVLTSPPALAYLRTPHHWASSRSFFSPAATDQAPLHPAHRLVELNQAGYESGQQRGTGRGGAGSGSGCSVAGSPVMTGRISGRLRGGSGRVRFPFSIGRSGTHNRPRPVTGCGSTSSSTVRRGGSSSAIV